MKLQFQFLNTLAALSLVVATAATGPVAADNDHDFDGLTPGEFVMLTQEVPIRIVFIGFEAGQVDQADLASVLPASSRPVVRYPQFYDLDGRNMGLEYQFRYQFVRKNRSFTDAFFRYLSQIGTDGPLTLYQQLYNAQTKNVRDVTAPVLYVSATRVEDWLNRHDSRSDRGYTIYFVNWHGRSDFRFHVYTKTDEPDPDTDFNFGELPHTAINSWGGTTSRTWFYDFSAGPEWNSTNWFVDKEDLGTDGIAEYRMPVSWEYAAGGYRSPDRLGHDMGLLTRYVAINLLFTSSPLYDPLVTAPGAFGAKVAHLTMLEDDPASKGRDFLDAGFATKKWRSFQPYYRWRIGTTNVDPVDAGAKNSLEIFTLNNVVPDCWVPFGTPFAQLFCYFDEHLGLYVPPYGPRDYVGEVFSYNTTAAGLGAQIGLLGFADDNWIDGTQSFSFVFGADAYRDSGYGFTSTAIHEFGHHIGVSHPHDGYDSEDAIDYGPSDEFYFAWEGDESDTVMSYLGISNGFGTHDRDNMYRWETAGYLNWANALAGDIQNAPDAWKVRGAVRLADASARIAIESFRGWRYLTAVVAARTAYATLAEAADRIGVSSTTLSAARMALPDSQPRKHVCRPRLLEERLRVR
jgi:hypothetical protein